MNLSIYKMLAACDAGTVAPFSNFVRHHYLIFYYISYAVHIALLNFVRRLAFQ